MDDLFRRAAENFPLKEADSHWDAIGARLNKPQGRPVKINSHRHVIFISVMIVLLLHLPFRLFETFSQEEKSQQASIVSKSGSSVEIAQDKRYQRVEDLSKVNKLIPLDSYSNIFNDSLQLIKESLQKTSNTNTRPGKMYESNEVAGSLPKDKMILDPTGENGEQIVMENNQKKDAKTSTVVVNELIPVETTSITTNNTTTATTSSSDTLLPPPTQLQIADSSTRKSSLGWYAGINTGISFSIVKGQQLSGPGFTAGLGLGYRFSPSWSVETGLKFSEKKYYSNGKYFKPKAPDANMPPDMQVVSVDSKTMLIEIPIRAKFNFKKTTKGQFFITGGISTYVVGKEISDYIIYRNGINGAMHATYDENKSYLAAAIDVSAGYEKFFKNKQTLRLEPWIQIAQKGIGVGQLPVSGFGVQAGYFFHK